MTAEPIDGGSGVTRAAARAATPGVLLAALVLVPFLDKALTIDDPVFMRMAEHALVDPLHPSAFEMVWGDAPGRVGLASGPVMAWLLVPAALAGGSETVAHLVQLALLVLAIFSTAALALRLGVSRAGATAAGALLASTPAVLAMAGTAMPDVPAMALGVLGLERLVAWRAERRAHQAALAVLALALAPLARPHLVLLLGVAALLLWRREEPGTRANTRDWAALALAPALTVVIALVVRDPHPEARGLVAAASSVSSLAYLGRNVVAFAVHWTLALPLALPWIAARPRAALSSWPVLLVATGAMLVHFGVEGLGPALALAAGLGVTVLWAIAADALRRGDAVQLALGGWLLVALATVPYPHLPAKYLIASAPAAAILVARAASALQPAHGRAVVVAACVLGSVLGTGILRADAALAGLGRRAAAELVAPYVAAGHRVWFVGHWGFQWYAERAGGRPVTLTPPYPERGDLVVSSRQSDPGNLMRMLMKRHASADRLARLTDDEPGGRVMSPASGAGFFSPGWGLLPWAWGRDPLDVFELWRIE